MDFEKSSCLAASTPGANMAQLCRELGVSRKNGYKWIRRFRAEGKAGLVGKSRRPQTIRHHGELVLRIIELRRRYPNGARRSFDKSCFVHQTG